MNLVDQYLVQAHQQDLLRAARIHRAGRCAGTRFPRLRRPHVTA